MSASRASDVTRYVIDRESHLLMLVTNGLQFEGPEGSLARRTLHCAAAGREACSLAERVDKARTILGFNVPVDR